jgi:hypothetical protein
MEQERAMHTAPWTTRSGLTIGMQSSARRRSERKDQRMAEVMIVRLTSNEELIGKVTFSEDDSTVHIDNPLILVPTRERSLALAPWMPYTTVADDGIDIDSDRVLFIVTPHKELSKEYTSAVTGLVLPDEKEVVGVIGKSLITE